jgi:PAS domain S-box-containing protein
MKRWWNNLPLRSKGLVLMAIPLVPLIVTTAVFARRQAIERDADAWVAHTLKVKADLRATLVSLVDAETAIRSYLLTGDRGSLEPYDRARAELPRQFADLQSLVSDNPLALQHLSAIRVLTDRRLAAVAAVIPYAYPAHPPASQLSDAAQLMDALRAEARSWQAMEDRLLADRAARSDAVRRETLAVIVVGALFGLGGGLGGVILFANGVSRRIEELNKNAHRLAHSQSLSAIDPAADEVGRLSERLAETAALLAERLKELEAARDELDRFFSLSLDMLCIADVDGYFKRVNPSWQELLGWSIDDLRAVPYAEFVHPDDRASTAAEAAKLAKGGVVVNFENRYRCKDGSFRWLNWKATAHPENGSIYAAARDVTEEKRTAELLKQQATALTAARLEAERANRAKNEFLSHMSHDLRTPLNAILGFAQLLDFEDLGPERGDNVRQILSGGQHLLDLITEVLDITRIESGQLSLSPEAVGVGEVVRRAVDLVKPLAAQRGIAIVLQPNGEGVTVVADRQRLSQILLNLLSNAVKYNRPEGRVTVGFDEIPPDRYRITVTDTGAGIPEAKLQVLFRPFERLGAEQTAVEGTGLGLALSRTLAEAMGGALGVDSSVDRGSTFWVELAVASSNESSAESLAPAAEAPAAPRAALPGTGILLYIEDNVANVHLMERVLRQRPGVQLVHAPTGESGIAAAASSRPDLVFLDLHLPDMSGDEVLRRLWEDPATRQIPLVMLTADATPGLARRLKSAGAVECLTKPLEIRRVLDVIDELMHGRLDRV